MRFLSALLAALALSHVTGQTLTVDPTQTDHAVSPTLWGVFFEEINHAGQGGLYSEMIRNRNFGGDNLFPWSVIGNAEYHLSDAYPLNVHNTQNLHVLFNTPTGNDGVSNAGFWGINIQQSVSYTVSLYAISSVDTTLTLQLVGSNGLSFWSQDFSLNGTTIKPSDVTLTPTTVVAEPWQHLTYTFTTFTVSPSSTFQIVVNNAKQGQELWLDMVSLRPTKGWHGLPYIRSDLADYVAGLAPAFVRFPGGCYSEGDHLGDRFNWKKALGPVETRPGHWDLWNYFSEDGLGLFEYLMFIEQLGARPIWVVNSGNSHNEQVNTKDIQPWIQDALDSLEFAMGASTTYWGAQRAAMGHPAPFNIWAVAIGNEDCGKDFYNSNYAAFYASLQKHYPAIKLIANCDLTQNKLPVQLWDYHVYQSAEWFFQNQNTFDSYPRDHAPQIFNSEYAMTDNKEIGKGNLLGAVAEAVWMTGLERNSDLVTLASYAPLFTNTNDRYWNPDAIVFNPAQAFGTPSYWNQYMWSRAQDNTANQVILLASWDTQPNVIAQSSTLASLTKGSGTHVAIVKVVNYGNSTEKITLSIPTSNTVGLASSSVDWRSMTSSTPQDENTFTQPKKVVPVDGVIILSSSNNAYTAPLTLPAYSIHVFRVYLNISSSKADAY